jgi:TPR repeat protein
MRFIKRFFFPFVALALISCGGGGNEASEPDIASNEANEPNMAPIEGGSATAMCPNGVSPDDIPDESDSLGDMTACAESGNADAQNYLGVRYDVGTLIPENDVQAVYWYRKAAEQGHAYARHNLGLMYEKGEGVPQNFSEALEWFRKSAEQGLHDGQFELGQAYDLGQGVAEDDAKAVEWYRKAADQGLAIAQLSIGMMYEAGAGVDRNLVQALKWYILAAGQQDGEALTKRDALRSKLSSEAALEAQQLATEWKPQR